MRDYGYKKRKYKKEWRALFIKAKKLGVKLEFHPEYFDYRRRNCLWYGGWLADIKVSDVYSIRLTIAGDVYATLYDEKENEIETVHDKNNAGVFGEEMKHYIKTDKQLEAALDSGRLILDYNNWIEYDGVIKRNASEKDGVFIDLSLFCDNVLNDDILSAIEEVLVAIKDITPDILFIAEKDYGITGVQL